MTNPNPLDMGARELPDNTICVRAESVGIVLAPADEAQIDFGLLLTAPPPLGAIRFALYAEQVQSLYEALQKIVTLTPTETAAVMARVHTPPNSNEEPENHA